jgi:hypothetical protein
MEIGLDLRCGRYSIRIAWDELLFLKDEETPMISSDYFERLVTSVERIARHAYYPGIDEAIEQCLEDIDELMHAGRITAEEREALRMLFGMTLTPSNNTSNAA